jgi:fermentation-respiration switch protein FrsA (DUF1100 family)
MVATRSSADPQAKPCTWRRWTLRWLLRLSLVYAGVLLVMLALENWLLYPRTTAGQYWQSPPDSRIRDVELQAADGNRIHAWWYPCEDASGAVLYCHGNAGNLSMRGSAVLQWQREMKESVLIFDYPGYGKSSGSPSEAGCYAAADAAYDWLTQEQKIPPDRLLLFGKSLGGGVAVDLASRRPHRALVLAKTFTSIPDVGQGLYPLLPVRFLMHNRFDTLAKIGQCHQPVFLAHGTTDTLIPLAHAERLFAAANEPKAFLAMPNVGHNDPFSPDFWSRLREFLARN